MLNFGPSLAISCQDYRAHLGICGIWELYSALTRGGIRGLKERERICYLMVLRTNCHLLAALGAIQGQFSYYCMVGKVLYITAVHPIFSFAPTGARSL